MRNNSIVRISFIRDKEIVFESNLFVRTKSLSFCRSFKPVALTTLARVR